MTFPAFQHEHAARLLVRASFLVACAVLCGAVARADDNQGPSEPGPITDSPPPLETNQQDCGCIDLVFIVDITASMSQALANITAVALPSAIDKAQVLSGGDLRVGLITFDGIVGAQHHDWVNVVFPLTSDTTAARAAIAALQLGGGGEAPEASDEALREMLDSSNCRLNGPDFNANGGFRPQCLKHAVLITDQIPGGCNDHVEPADTTNAYAMADLAASMGVMITPIYVNSGGNPDVYLLMHHHYAKLTGGTYSEVNSRAEGAGLVIQQSLERGDCNCNGTPDIQEIRSGSATDCTTNGLLDECEPDCNNNGIADSCDIAGGMSDCNLNGVPDACDIPIVFVNAQAGGANNGTRWEDAFTNLQQALALCSECVQREVWVAGGTYYPGAPGSIRESSFVLCSQLQVYGGFLGGEMALEERDPVANLTTLSGDLGRNDGLGTTSDNAYHVVYAPNLANRVDMDVFLDGFTITGGNADGTDDNAYGGGLLIKGGQLGDFTNEPRIRNVTFEGNHATYGGGMALITAASSAIFESLRFVGNTAAARGGAVYAKDAGTLARLRRSLFEDNGVDEGDGGAIFAEGAGNVIVHDSVFSGNFADYGGALRVGPRDANSSSIKAYNCTFRNNWAEHSGGVAEVADLAGQPQASLTLDNCILWGNYGNDPSGRGHELSIHQGPGLLTVQNSDVQGGSGDVDNAANGTLSYAGTNIASDPLFADLLGRIGRSSPCLDKGQGMVWIPYLDFDGNPRVIDGDVNGTATADMGAFEFPLGIPDCHDADVNCDGHVNGSDILSVRAPSTWNHAVVCPNGPTDPNPRADVDNSGFIDGSDILSIRAPGVWNSSTGECYCVPGCPAQQGLLEGGEYLAGYSSGESPEPSWDGTNGDLALEIRPVGGGAALSTLAAHTTYEVHYASSLAVADYFVGATAEGGAVLTDVDPAAGGPWAEVDQFLFEAGTGLFANDLRAGGHAAGSGGVLCRITTGEAGALTLEVTLTWTDEGTSEGGVAAGSVTVTVQ